MFVLQFPNVILLKGFSAIAAQLLFPRLPGLKPTTVTVCLTTYRPAKHSSSSELNWAFQLLPNITYKHMSRVPLY